MVKHDLVSGIEDNEQQPYKPVEVGANGSGAVHKIAEDRRQESGTLQH